MPKVSMSSLNQSIDAAGMTDAGTVREHNEDAFLVRNDLCLFMVADGAGGHNAGDIASKLAIKSIENFFEATESVAKTRPERDRFGLMTQARRLAAAVQKANADVMEISRSFEKRKGMGTTVVVAYLRPSWNRLYLAHVGDSRCYRVRGEHVEVLTHDHTILNDVMEMRPDVGDDVLARLPRSVVTRALGMGKRIRVDLRAFVLVPGDRYLLCSDGLYRDLPEDVLFETLRITAEPEEVAQRLIALGKKAGGGDNLTALVFDCVRLGKPSHDKQGADSSSTRRKTASAPEILLLGIESDVDIQPTGEVQILPSDAYDAEVRQAVEDFVSPLRPDHAALPIDLTKTSQCGACGEQIPVGARFCPYCGAPRKT